MDGNLRMNYKFLRHKISVVEKVDSRAAITTVYNSYRETAEE